MTELDIYPHSVIYLVVGAFLTMGFLWHYNRLITIADDVIQAFKHLFTSARDPQRKRPATSDMDMTGADDIDLTSGNSFQWTVGYTLAAAFIILTVVMAGAVYIGMIDVVPAVAFSGSVAVFGFMTYLNDGGTVLAPQQIGGGSSNSVMD